MKLVSVDFTRKEKVSLPAPVPGITRVAFLKIVGVTTSYHFTQFTDWY